MSAAKTSTTTQPQQHRNKKNIYISIYTQTTKGGKERKKRPRRFKRNIEGTHSAILYPRIHTHTQGINKSINIYILFIDLQATGSGQCDDRNIQTYFNTQRTELIYDFLLFFFNKPTESPDDRITALPKKKNYSRTFHRVRAKEGRDDHHHHHGQHQNRQRRAEARG